MEDTFISYLKGIYLDTTSPVAFSSPRSVLNYIKAQNKYSNIGVERLTRYMNAFDSYSLTKNRPSHRTVTRRYGVMRPNFELEVDLMSIMRFSDDNDGWLYILVAIDVFSKHLYAKPLKDKRGVTVATAMGQILDDVSGHIKGIHSDRGSEFVSSEFVRLLKRRNIIQTFAKQSLKAVMAERVISSLRKLFRGYRISNNTLSFVHKLQDFVHIYNSRIHSSTKQSPNTINDYNATFASDELYKGYEPRPIKPYKFKIGDSVRISTEKTLFDKYSGNFSEEIFNVAMRYRKDGLNIYEIEGCSGPILGSFYQGDLLLVRDAKDRAYQIEKFLDEKMINKTKHVLVKFRGYPDNDKCNAWLRKSDVVDI